jgi:uncharacterized protein (DUF2252 family)
LALRQLDLDRARTRRYPELLARKLARMSESPLAFLRGAAPLFYEILAAEPELAAGPAGSGWIQGDAHLENFGAYSPARHEGELWKKGHASFNLNDFDEATRGAWRWDVLRLATSLLLAGRELGQSGPVVLGLCEKLLDSHAAASGTDVPLPPAPPSVRRMIERVDARSGKKLLEDRTRVDSAGRHFIRGERYWDAPQDVAAAVPEALALFAERSAATGGPKLEQLEILDVAFRIAGTGSLGALRIAALVRGKGSEDGGWLFDLKEQSGSSVDVLSPRSGTGSRAAEVEAAFRACVAGPPRMMGTSVLAGHEVLVRRLTPQEDKLSLRQLDASELGVLAAHLGALLGGAHRLGRSDAFTPWTESERSQLLERAIRLAGIHEAVYLELCLLTNARPLMG